MSKKKKKKRLPQKKPQKQTNKQSKTKEVNKTGVIEMGKCLIRYQSCY